MSPSSSARRRAVLGLVTAAVVLAPLAPIRRPFGTGRASALDGPPNTLQLDTTTVNLAAAGPNATLTYTVSYTCPAIVAGGTCATATVTDPLPSFTDIDGNLRQLTFVAAVGNSHFAAGSVSGAVPDQLVTWHANAALVAGASGALSLSVRVPRGLVPVAPQPVTDIATATLAGLTDDSTSASTTISATGTDYSFTTTGPATLLVNTNGTYNRKVCPSPNTAALAPSVAIVDTLPAGATFVSATNGGAYVDNADPTPDTIAWTVVAANRPTLDTNGCFTISNVVKFVPPGSGGAASNIPATVKADTATATVGAAVRSSSVNTTLTGPVTRVTRTKSVTVGGTYVTDGDRVTYGLQLQNNSDVGADPLSTASLTDGPLPSGFTLDRITTGTWPWGSTASVDISDNGTVWTTVAGGLTGVGAATITSGLSTARWVRWNLTGPIAVGQSTSAATVSGLVTGAVVPSTTLTNCLTAAATQGAAIVAGGSQCSNVTLEVPQPHPWIVELITGATSATMVPGGSATYTIAVGNNADATSPLANPTVVGCVPAGFAVTSVPAAAGWTRDSGYTNTACASAGGTPLRFTYSGTLGQGAPAATISYVVEANGFGDPDGPIVTPGNYANTATVRTSTGTAFGHCVQAGCSSTATATVAVVAQLTSSTAAQGALDSGWSSAATTMPGAGVTWRLDLQNSGNVGASNPVIIDIFPHVGDTGVLAWNVARGSEYGTFLVTPITAPAGWTVSYSRSANPCRSEVGGPVTGCDTPNWATTPGTLLLPTYRSVRFSYAGVVPRGAVAQFTWQSRTPVLDAAYDTGDTTASPYDDVIACAATPSTCPKAVDSFAAGTAADPADLNGMTDPGLLSAEPSPASVSITAPPRPNLLGNEVFDDADHDGVREAGEAGIPGVRVELDQDVAGSWVQYGPYGFTYTDAFGFYLFPDLPAGDFRLRFHLPDTSSYVTTQDATGYPGDDPDSNNSGDDSDVPSTPTGSDSSGNFYETDGIALGNNGGEEIDDSWGAGVWFPAPAIRVVKQVDGADADAAPGIERYPGDPLVWTYTITNSGNTYLSDVLLVDHVTMGAASDPAPVCDWASSSDLLTPAGYLSRGETVVCDASDVAITGAYANTATVTGLGTLDPPDPMDGATYDVLDRLAAGQRAVSDTDTAHYTGLTYAVGDLVFLDVDDDGTYDPPTDVPIINGTTVQLYDDSDTLIASTATSAGRYLFSGLRTGSYYVRIPGSEFAVGSPLVDMGAAPSPVLDPNTDADENADHHAISDGAGGVRSSGLLTLSSSVAGSAFVGDEPTGDDPGLIATGLNDRRTNQTLDLALRAPGALAVSMQVDTGSGWGETTRIGFLAGVTWRITVSNTGGQNLHGITVVDAPSPTCDMSYTAGGGVLPPGASFTVTCASAGLVAGFDNVARVAGTDPTGDTVTGADSAAVTVDPPVPGIALAKYVTENIADPTAGPLHDADDAPGFDAAPGTQVRWVYAVANTGNTPLDISSFVDTNTSALSGDDFLVTSSMYVGGDSDGDNLLSTGEVWQFVASASTVMAIGQTETSATVWAIPTDTTGTHLSAAVAVVAQNAANHFGVITGVTVETTANGRAAATAPGPFVRVGDTVTWSYVVTNTGNTHLADVVVAAVPAATISCPTGNPIPLLAPGASAICTSSTDTSALLGRYHDDVSVTGSPADVHGAPVVGPGIADPPDSDTGYFFAAAPAVAIVTTANADDADTGPGPTVFAGDVVTWRYLVTNVGNSPLADLTVVDDARTADAAIDCGAGTATVAALAVGDTITCNATSLAVAGQYSNSGAVSATATELDGHPIIEPGSGGPLPRLVAWDPAHYFGAAPGLSIEAVACTLVDPTECDPAVDAHWSKNAVVATAGRGVWRMIVRNTGNVTVVNVTVDDPLDPGCDQTFASIAAGDRRTWTCDRTDVDAPLDNRATATGTPVDADGRPIVRLGSLAPVMVTGSDHASVTPPANLRIVMSVDSQHVGVGSLVTWTVTVSNDGPGLAAGVSVEDWLPRGLEPARLPEGTTFDAWTRQLHWQLGTMAVGEPATMTYVTKVTAAATGSLTNVARVMSASPFVEPVLIDNDSRATVLAEGGSLPKTGSGPVLLVDLSAWLWAVGAVIVLFNRRTRTR